VQNMNNSTVHFFDLDYTLWNTNAKWWIVNKNDPEHAIFKIPQHEGYLISNGFYAKFGHQIYYNGYIGWISDQMFLEIKKLDLELSDIGMSLREYKDQALIESQITNMVFYVDNIKHLKGRNDTINLLTARQNKKAHENMLKTLRDKLTEHDIHVNYEYFVNDPLEIKCVGNTPEKKLMVLLQHIVGYKLEGREFKPILIDKYDNTYFYDDEEINIEECKKINQYLKEYVQNSIEFMREKVETSIRLRKPKLYLNQVTTNELNPFIETIVEINI